MRTTVFLLLLAAMPVSGAIRPDRPLAPAVIGAAATDQEFARVATDGTNFFVVWRKLTASNTIIIGGGRLSPSGELLDHPSILLASGPYLTLGLPDVVFVGGIFLVAYPSGTSVVTRRFYRNGEPVDPQPVVISNCAMPVGLATNGRTVLLTTARNRFRLLASDGTPIGAEREIPKAGTGKWSVTSNGDQYLIAYPREGISSDSGVFVLLSRDGDFLIAKTMVGGYEVSVTAASNGSSFLIVLAYRRILCMSVDSNGNAGLLHEIGGLYYRTDIVATSRGNDYELFWTDRASPTGVTASFGERIDADGLPIDDQAVVVAPITRTLNGLRNLEVFASASNGRDTLVITANSGYYDRDDWRTEAAIFSSLPQIDAEPANRRHVAIASSAAEQANASIASNGTVSLVAWRERSGFDQAIVRAAFISVDGELGPPMEIGKASAQSPTAIASNGRDFLISYIDSDYMLAARRVTLEGIADTKPFRLMYLKAYPQVSRYQIAAGWSGAFYFVVTAAYEFTAVAAVPPDADYGIIKPSCDSLRPLSFAEAPAIHCYARECAITWRATAFPSEGESSDVLTNTLCFADKFGNPLSTVDFAEGTTPGISMPPSEGKALFVYSSGKSMFAGRITSHGVVLDPPAFDGGVRVMTSETAFPLQPVAAVYDGLYFVEPDSATTGRLFWTRIAPEPKPRVEALINLHETVTLPVTLTASARNTYLVYSNDDDKLVAPRLFLRTLTSPDPLPAQVRKHAIH